MDLQNILALCSKYKQSFKYEQWASRAGYNAPQILGKLILNGALKGQSLHILEIACHNGNLLDSMYRIPNLRNRIVRYCGVDTSRDALTKAKNKYPNHNFIEANVLLEDVANDERIPRDNNIVVCSGFFDYLSPSDIKWILKFLETKLVNNELARIYVNYPTTLPVYALSVKKPLLVTESFYRDYDAYYGNTPSAEDGVQYIISTKGSIPLYRYEPAEFSKLIDHANLEIDINNSQGTLPKRISDNALIGMRAYNHLCLKRVN